MMAPTVVLGEDGAPELALGWAGSNRIRSALLQVIVNTIDHGLDVASAVQAPRLHFEQGVVYAEPGIALEEIGRSGHRLARFGAPNLFFGGVQAVRRDPSSGELSAGADFRRGGAAVVVA